MGHRIKIDHKPESYIKMWNQGFSMKAICERYGVGRQKVRKVLHEAGINIATAYRHHDCWVGGSVQRFGSLDARRQYE